MKQPETTDKPILLVDGLNLFMRAFVVSPAMATTGEHCGGFIGFLATLGNLCEKFNPSQVVVVWESGGSAKKRNIDPGYKNGRRPPKLNRYYEDDIPATANNHTTQVSSLVRALGYLPVTQIYVRDCEADDVIGYLGRYVFRSTRVILVSSDRDLYQLIDDRLQQWSPGQKRLIDRQAVVDKFGVSPENFCSARAFVGDPGDSIPGVKGVGFKSLSKWFPQLAGDEFVSYGQVVAAAKTMIIDGSKGATINRIAEANDTAAKNWKLMYLDTCQLAGDQIKKINDQIENRGKSDKMSLMRLMCELGMQKFDINRNFSAINTTRKN